MTRTAEEILAERRLLRAEYGELFDLVAAVLFRHDPMRINFEINTDEYALEAGTILPRLRNCNPLELPNVRQIVHEEFVRWFDSATVGPEGRYTEIASEILRLWREKRS